MWRSLNVTSATSHSLAKASHRCGLVQGTEVDSVPWQEELYPTWRLWQLQSPLEAICLLPQECMRDLKRYSEKAV